MVTRDGVELSCGGDKLFFLDSHFALFSELAPNSRISSSLSQIGGRLSQIGKIEYRHDSLTAWGLVTANNCAKSAATCTTIPPLSAEFPLHHLTGAD